MLYKKIDLLTNENVKLKKRINNLEKKDYEITIENESLKSHIKNVVNENKQLKEKMYEPQNQIILLKEEQSNNEEVQKRKWKWSK